MESGGCGELGTLTTYSKRKCSLFCQWLAISPKNNKTFYMFFILFLWMNIYYRNNIKFENFHALVITVLFIFMNDLETA